MKKILCLVIVITLLLGCFACSNKGDASMDKNHFLLKESISLTFDMDELADSEEFMSLMNSTGSINQIAAEISNQDYMSPKTAYLLELPDDMLKQLVSSLDGNNDILKNMSDSILEKISAQMNRSTLWSSINASAGYDVLAATSLLSYGKSYLQPKGWTKNTIVLLMYDGNYSSMISFTQSGEGIISAAANFIKNNEIMDKLKSTKDSTPLWEQLFGITGIQYKEYTSTDLEKMLPDIK